MTYYAHKPVAVLIYCFMASVAFSFPAQTKTTFLPDFEEEPMKFSCEEGGGEDYCLCQRSTNPVYHLVQSFPKCSSPKIFDKTCPHSDDWITECYCPASYNQICTLPYRGAGLNCDGKYEKCCDTRCLEGSTNSCSYPYVLDYTSSTDCGETCYVCRYGNDCITNCSSDEEASYNGSYNDFTGEACVTCTPLTPPCTDTCSSKGYKSSQPSGQTCSTTTVCENTCYYDCKPNDPCAGITCPGGKVCSNGSCVCPNGQKDCGGTCKNCCSDKDCKNGNTCQNGSCVCPNKYCHGGQVCTSKNSCGGCTACSCPTGKEWNSEYNLCGCKTSGCESFKNMWCGQTFSGVCIGGTLHTCTYTDFSCKSYKLQYCCSN